MLSPARALVKAGENDPLPTVFPALERRGIRMMRAEVTMIAGQPNAGKSMVALYMSKIFSEMGERVLYFSADSNESTQSTRLAAVVSGDRIAEIRQSVSEGGLGFYEQQLEDVDIRFDFNSNPTLDDIELTMLAYEEMYGDHPTVVIVDNLMNVEGASGDGDNEKHGLIQIQKFMKWMCRDTRAAFIVLHHCSEAKGKPHLPPARSEIQQKVNELPEVQLTVAYNRETSQLGVAAVKNRHGRADPSAADPVWLWADMDRGRFFSEKFDAVMAGVA